jgi:hypothetical protein
MTARFPGTCLRCHRPIAVGDQIEWKKGEGATHAPGVCEAQAIPEPEGDLKRVVDHLYDRSRKGTLNEFTASLLRQYEKKGTLSEKQQQAILKRLKAPDAPPVPQLPAGRYAVTVDQEVLLVNVWHPKGNPEVQRLYRVQSHDDSGDVLRGDLELKAALEIKKDPAAAAIEFGHRTGHCFRCGAELDVNLSKSMGVGPTCAKHVKENDNRLAMMAEHREHIRSHGFDPADRNDDVPPFTKKLVAA